MALRGAQAPACALMSRQVSPASSRWSLSITIVISFSASFVRSRPFARAGFHHQLAGPVKCFTALGSCTKRRQLLHFFPFPNNCRAQFPRSSRIAIRPRFRTVP